MGDEVTKAISNIQSGRYSSSKKVIESIGIDEELVRTAHRALEAADKCYECKSSKTINFKSDESRELFDTLMDDGGFSKQLPIAARVFVKRHVDRNFETIIEVNKALRTIKFTCYIPENVIDKGYN